MTFVFVVSDVIRRLPEGERVKSIKSFLCFKSARQAFGQHLWTLHGARSMLGRHAYEVSKDAFLSFATDSPLLLCFVNGFQVSFPDGICHHADN